MALFWASVLRVRRHRRLRAGLLGVGLLVPTVAAAGDGLIPRVPVGWPDDTPCMTVVDRSRSPMLHLPYGILYEDTELTSDELPTSRRHQFFAFCRNNSPQDFLPTWVSLSDVGAWNEWLMTLGAAPLVLGGEDVLETSSTWGDCFVRITADDARRPITFAEADKGVDWDTSGLGAGAYVVQGYTWHPGVNIWSKRPGVIHVVDGPDLATVGPAAALTNQEDYLFADDTLELRGCARALPGSTLTVYWSLTEMGLDWQLYAEGLPLDGEMIAVPFSPPPESVMQMIALRVDVVDPMQRSFSAFPRELVSVLPAGAGSTAGCGDSGSFIGETCGEDSETGDASSGTGGSPTTGTSGTTTGTTGASTGGETTTSTSTPMQEPAASDGCACASGGASGGPALVVFAALGVRRRGRRRKRGSALGPV